MQTEGSDQWTENQSSEPSSATEAFHITTSAQTWSPVDFLHECLTARRITSGFNGDLSAIRQHCTRVSNEILSASWVVRAFVANCRRGCSRAIMTVFEIRSHDFFVAWLPPIAVNFDFVNPSQGNLRPCNQQCLFLFYFSIKTLISSNMSLVHRPLCDGGLTLRHGVRSIFGLVWSCVGLGWVGSNLVIFSVIWFQYYVNSRVDVWKR